MPQCQAPLGSTGAQNRIGRIPVIDNQKLATTLRSFAAERDWDQFHTPKNLATSLSVEAGELMELFPSGREDKTGR